MSEIDCILQQRGKTHGDWPEVARKSQKMKNIMRSSKNWDTMPTNMKEAIEMICTKMSRIANGNYNHADSWNDIAGYATLASKSIEK